MRDFDIESDLKQEKFQNIKLVQGDRGNKIKINIYEDGQPVNLTGCSITAKYKRADGEVVNDGIIENINDNYFYAVMDSDITKASGTLKMIFTIEKDDVKVSTFLLLADVREGIGENTGSSGGDTEVTVDLKDYQKKTDNGLETKNKYIVGAINEVNSQCKDIANVSNEFYKPSVTFISDDGKIEDYTKLYPLFKSEGIKFCSSVHVNALDNTGGLTTENIIEMQNYGIEIGSHTVNHLVLNTISDEKQIYEISESKKKLSAIGINANFIAYPQGKSTEVSRKTSRDYYKCAFSTIEELNIPPLKTFNLGRIFLGAYYNGTSNPGTLDFYKNRVDECISKNAWLVFCLHPADTSEEQIGYIRDVIAYCKNKNVDIITVSEGLKKFGNRFDAGDNYEFNSNLRLESNNTYTSIGKNGEYESNMLDKGLIEYFDISNVSSTTLLDDFPNNKISITILLDSNAHDFPLSMGGVLETCKVRYNDIAYQIYKPRNTGRIFKRGWNSDGSWANWKEIGINETGIYSTLNNLNQFDANSAISAFPAGLSYTYINSAGKSTFPEKESGILITYNCKSTKGYQKQIYYLYNKNRYYIRTYKEDGTWSSWGSVLLDTDILKVSQGVSFGTISAKSTKDVEVSVTGAKLNNTVLANPRESLEDGLIWNAYISAENVVTIRIANMTDSQIVVSGRTWNIIVNTF